MLQYIILNNTLEKLVPGNEILFYLPSGNTYRGQISLGIIGYYCSLSNVYNARIFEELEIYDANDFVKKIVGYDCEGTWPEVKSIDDLKKVIKALDYECVKKFGECNTPKFKVGDKVRILPRKGDPEDYIGTYIDEMLQFVGKTATIREISLGGIYLVENDWTWDPKALELVDEKEESKTININQVKIDKPETQFEAEVNLFPTKKHYQLNFNY